MDTRLHARRFGNGLPLVALHGFTQTGGMFEEGAALLDREVLAPDLPGHGGSTAGPATFASAVSRVADLLVTSGGPVPLLGYSQGGRVALGVALHRPALVSRLVLVSANAGLADPGKRAARRVRDEGLARSLETEGLVAFLDRWAGQAMFAGSRRRGGSWLAADRARREHNTAAGLAAALRGMGQGSQPYLGERLGELPMPVLLVVGELDEVYVATARAMADRINGAELVIVPGGGHALVGEDPVSVFDAVGRFLDG